MTFDMAEAAVRAHFAYRLYCALCNRARQPQHNPIIVQWRDGSWQRVGDTVAANRNPITVLVEDGEDVTVVAYGINGALNA